MPAIRVVSQFRWRAIVIQRVSLLSSTLCCTAEALVNNNHAIADRWLTCMLRSYPGETARFFAESHDRFHNPVGFAYRESAAIVVDELLGGMDFARITPALQQIVEMRAVQNFTPRDALAF